MTKLKSTNKKVLDDLIQKEGIAEYIRDYYSAINGHLKILYAQKDFYIAEDTTYQPWLSVMGHIPKDIEEQHFYSMLSDYIENDRYIAVYTNNKRVSCFLQKFDFFSYHEDFSVALLLKNQNFGEIGIRLATADDLPYIEKTYKRSGHNQLLNRITQQQMWVLEENGCIKGYAGIHKDCSLGFEYVSPNYRRQHVASRLQYFIANYMFEIDLIPYVMISIENGAAKNFQAKLNCDFANNLFYFYAKGAYEFE